MATYEMVSRTVPSTERSALITDVEVGDQIDIAMILGRPARGLKFITTSATDEVEYRLNSLQKLPRHNTPEDSNTFYDEVSFWNKSNRFPIYNDIGLQIETMEGLKISSVEIFDLTLDTGSTISIVVW